MNIPKIEFLTNVLIDSGSENFSDLWDIYYEKDDLETNKLQLFEEDDFPVVSKILKRFFRYDGKEFDDGDSIDVQSTLHGAIFGLLFLEDDVLGLYFKPGDEDDELTVFLHPEEE